MARAKAQPARRKRRKKQKRSDAEYVSSAKNLSSLVPSLRKLSRRKKLRPSEKAAITRKEKALKGVPNIFPVTAQEAKRIGKQKLFAPGIRGIQLRNVSPQAKIIYRKGGGISVEDNGRRWIYWPLDKPTVRSRVGMRNAGRQAFEQQFPIERISELTERAFKKYDVVQVNLWAHAGIVGDPHHTVKQFTLWVNEKWSAGRYMRTSEFGGTSDPGKWVNGIAILLESKEYAERRRKAEEENAGVLEEMERLGREARKRETARLVKAGLIQPEKPAPKKRKRPPTKRNRK